MTAKENIKADISGYIKSLDSLSHFFNLTAGEKCSYIKEKFRESDLGNRVFWRKKSQ